MYRKVLRDPGGSSLVRIIPDVCSDRQTVVDGSVLIVPPGTVAYVVMNGSISHPYHPGRYELFTGVDPFFVRLRHLMTHGDPGISVSVFFISTEKNHFMQMGSGRLPFRENRFQITLQAMAACKLTISVEDPMKLLKKLIGSYNTDFTEEDLEPCMEQMMLLPLRESLSNVLSTISITEFNSQLTAISNRVQARAVGPFSEFGLGLERFHVVEINLPREESARLAELEQKYAKEKIDTDIEMDHLERVWSGDIDKRTMAEMMTGMVSRGAGYKGENGNAGGGSGMAQMMQMMLFAEMMQEEKTCPVCKQKMKRFTTVCPQCGHRFHII